MREIPGGRLVVVGGGAWGTTLASLQAHNFAGVTLLVVERDIPEEVLRFRTNERYCGDWRLPPNVQATADPDRALAGADMILVAVPSGAVRDVAREVGGRCAGRLPVVLATKGMERGTGLLSIEVWREQWGHTPKRTVRDPLVLSGPNLACELRAGGASVAVLAGTSGTAVRRAAAQLSHPRLALFPFHDPLGAQAAGALKNVYAVACGLAAGLEWGDNVVATIIWRGLAETACFAAALGGDPAVVSTPAGIGDFVATCTSPLSRNHNLGKALAGRGGAREDVSGVVEGAQSAAEAARRGRALGLALPLLERIAAVLAGEAGHRCIIEAAVNGKPAGRVRPTAREQVANARLAALRVPVAEAMEGP